MLLCRMADSNSGTKRLMVILDDENFYCGARSPSSFGRANAAKSPAPIVLIAKLA
jgi:hypothetical protein